MIKKKLFLICPMLHQGGFERVCIHTARLLAPYYDVSIVIFDDRNIAYDITGLKIINLDLGVRKGKIRKIINVFRRASALRKLKNAEKPVAAYSFGPTANYVNCLSRTDDTKVVTGLRNYTDIENERDIRLFIRRSDLIIGCSKSIESVLRDRFHYERGVTLYNPFDLEMIRQQADLADPELPWEEDRFIIAASGRVAPQKGYWHMLKAFSIVHQKHPEAALIIMGAGDPKKYEELAEALNIRDAVYFAGMQKNPFSFLIKSDLYLMTSENEGFPNALVEGMALGLPAVSVDCESGPREIFLSDEELSSCPEKLDHVLDGSYGLLCPQITKGENLDPSHFEDAEEKIAEAVLRLMDDRSLYEHYSDRSRERAAEFGGESYLNRLLDIFGGLS